MDGYPPYHVLTIVRPLQASLGYPGGARLVGAVGTRQQVVLEDAATCSRAGEVRELLGDACSVGSESEARENQ